MSKFDFGRRVARAFGFDDASVPRSSLAERGLDAARGQHLDVLPTEPPAGLDPNVADLDAGLGRLQRAAAGGLRDRLAALLHAPPPGGTQ
jgi:hypothetical protein